MRKILLLTLVLSFTAVAFAQQLTPVAKDVKDISVIREYKVPSDPVPPMVNPNYVPSGQLKEAKTVGAETEIIETVYDLQSNSALADRFWVWDDGTMAAVCTRGIDEPSGFTFPDRGTGYNYYDGSSWGPKPSQRIEDARTGWPSLAPWGPNGEIIVAHTATDLRFSRRENKGTGPWTTINYAGLGAPTYPSWPRVVTSGDNHEYVHLFYNSYDTYMGQTQALVYSRSQDGGDTWDWEDEIIDGLGSDYYLGISADDYICVSKGNTVALIIGSPWFDLAMFKSTDNGETWDKTVIWEHPYPFFDINSTLTSDTLWAVDGSFDAAIDDNGQVHVVFGITRVARLESSPPDPGTYSYWPFTDGIGYWDETMEAPIPEAENPHHTLMDTYLDGMGMLVGWSQDVNGSGVRLDFEGTAETPFAVYRELGISCQPTLAIKGNMMVLGYSSVTETYLTSDGAYNYKHIWVRASYDLGNSWEMFTDLQANEIFHLYDECIYPLLGKNTSMDGVFHLIYQADNLPGLFLDEDEQLEPTTNRIIHNTMDFLTDINEPVATVNSNVEVSECYPNPAHGTTRLTVELPSAADVSVSFYNMTGQQVMQIPATALQAGSHALSFDASSLTPGVYFYTLTAGTQSVSKKMIVE